MKKLLLLVCFLALGSNLTHAEKSQIILGCQKIKETHYPGHGKAPMRMPIIYQDGYTLSLSAFHPEYIINIVQDDEVIYTSIIPEGITEYELPSYLCGECEIQFVSGSFCFTGLIIL